MSDKGFKDSTNNVNSQYLAHFRRHLAQVQAHFNGDDERTLLPSFIHPAGYWTSAEKNAFFHALSVHSRLRPDLIAACVKTKTMLDVCAYLDILEAATMNHSGNIRRALEGAIEVSDEWMEWEEANASILAATEPSWDQQMTESRMDEMQENLISWHNSTDGQTHEDATKEGIIRWRQENAMNALDLSHLTVMEAILRDAESSANPDEVFSAEQTFSAHTSPVAPRTSTFSCPEIGQQTVSASWDDACTDPALLSTPNRQSAPLQLSGSLPLHLELSPLRHAQGSIIPSYVGFSLTSQDSEDLHLGDTQHLQYSTDMLSTSRRRLQKRLYMRRKRAEARGEDIIPEVAKLRPGRKTKEKKKPKPRPKKYKKGLGEGGVKKEDEVEGEEADGQLVQSVAPPSPQPSGLSTGPAGDGEDFFDESTYAARRRAGLTRPYKLRKIFAENGIDADTLNKGGLGLFHLTTLGRLMNLYRSGYDSAQNEDTSSISADTIRLLSAIVSEFITELVQRTIIPREQEKKIKGNIKVWGRSHDEITKDNVKHALHTMGMQDLNKKCYFEQLLGDDNSDPDEDEEGMGLGERNQRDTMEEDNCSTNSEQAKQAENSQRPSYPAMLSLRREFHSPHVNFSRGFALRDQAKAGFIHDHLLPLDTDEDELLAELEDEIILDEQDRMLDDLCEQDLWRGVPLSNL